jgi:hypothetical protein
VISLTPNPAPVRGRGELSAFGRYMGTGTHAYDGAALCLA